MSKDTNKSVFTHFGVNKAPYSFLPWLLVVFVKLKLDKFFIDGNSKDQVYFESMNGKGTILVEDFINRYR